MIKFQEILYWTQSLSDMSAWLKNLRPQQCPVTAVQQVRLTVENPVPMKANRPSILWCLKIVEPLSQDTAGDEDSRAMPTCHLDSASNTKFLEIY